LHQPQAIHTGIQLLREGRERHPGRLIVNAEPPYERLGGGNGPDVQRHAFWSTMLSGGAGFTYGAAGLFEANDRERPTGPRPDGGTFNGVFWDEALQFPGAEQVAAGHRLLCGLPLHRFEPHPEWVESAVCANAEKSRPPFLGVPEVCRVIYLPMRWFQWDGPLIRGLEPSAVYSADYIAPDTLRRHPCGLVKGDADGTWRAPKLPYMHDWLLLLERIRGVPSSSA
jgi:Protein of unknown function (DUF4038)